MNEFETLTECLVECIKAAGGSKVVGSKLWPEKAMDAAQRHLLNCMNEGKAERLNPDQVMLVASLARAKGCDAYMAYCSQHLHYEMPKPREPRDEMAELQRAFVQSVAAQQQMLAQMQALAGQVSPTGLKAVA